METLNDPPKIDDGLLERTLGDMSTHEQKGARVQKMVGDYIADSLVWHGRALIKAARASDKYASRLVVATWALVLATIVLVIATLRLAT